MRRFFLRGDVRRGQFLAGIASADNKEFSQAVAAVAATAAAVRLSDWRHHQGRRRLPERPRGQPTAGPTGRANGFVHARREQSCQPARGQVDQEELGRHATKQARSRAAKWPPKHRPVEDGMTNMRKTIFPDP